MSGDAALGRLVSHLTAQLDVLDEVEYRHHVCLLLLGASSPQHLAGALDDLLDAEERLGREELVRIAAVADLAARWDLDPVEARLGDIIGRADPDDRPHLEALGAELRSRTDEIVRARGLVAELAGRQAEVVHARLDGVLTGPSTGYDATGVATRIPTSTTRPRFGG